MSALKKSDTVFEKVRNDILIQIATERLNPTDKLSSIRETAEKCGCCKATAQMILNSLCEEGILYKVPGDGYFVAMNVQEKAMELCFGKMDNALSNYIEQGHKLGLTNDALIERLRNSLS